MEETTSLMTKLGQFLGDKFNALSNRIAALESGGVGGNCHCGTFEDMLSAYNTAVGGETSPLYDDGSAYTD